MKIFTAVFLTFILILCVTELLAQEPDSVIGIDEKLGSYVPVDLTFQDENNKTVTLKEVVNNKPAILTLVYYRCPSICNPLMGGLVETLDEIRLNPSDYSVITISFDPLDKPEDSKNKKKNFLNSFKKPFPEGTWRFLTGTQENINKITDAVGFKYKQEGTEYLHPAGLTVLSPDGKITRYLYGIYFLPFDLEMALTEAAKGTVGTPVTRAISYCFVYNPGGKKYILDITRISAVITLILVLIILSYIFLYKKKMKGTENAGK